MLLSPKKQKLPIVSLVVLHWMLFLKTRPFVKQNNTKFTNISSFTSLLMCSTHFTLSCRILLFPSPPATIFSSLCIMKSPESLPRRSCLGPLSVVCFSCNRWSSQLDSLRFWTSDIQDLPTSCRNFLYLTFSFEFSVLYTKNALIADTVTFFFFYHFTVFLKTE